MSIGTMKGNQYEQVSGGVSPDLLARIAALETKVNALEGTHADSNNYGTVKLSNAADVTDSTGLAVPTSELNATIGGTLANLIKKHNALNGTIGVNVPLTTYKLPQMGVYILSTIHGGAWSGMCGCYIVHYNPIYDGTCLLTPIRAISQSGVSVTVDTQGIHIVNNSAGGIYVYIKSLVI